ncbi:MAG TPA: hypothetical protein VEX68_17055 [Bryobacteraceae bacterium]|nr:hypothetical protein [Bryobacteraceae bacterium]
MDGQLLHAAEQLRKRLKLLDPHDRDSLVWLHGYLTSVIQDLESGLPDLMTSQTLLDTLKARLASLPLGRFDEPDSLDLLNDELGDAPVPAKLNPRPKGLSGGAIVPLPDNELPS